MRRFQFYNEAQLHRLHNCMLDRSLRKMHVMTSVLIISLLSALFPVYGQLPSPVSEQVLAISNANWFAKGEVTGFPSESFTVEGYVYLPSYPPYSNFALLQKEGFAEIIVSQYSQYTYPYNTYYDIFFGVATGSDGQFSGPGVHILYYNISSSWLHVAVTYDSSTDTKRIYLNGTLYSPNYSSTKTYSTPPSTDALVGGLSTSDSSLGYFVDGLRVSSGIRYDGNFTPPSSPFSPDETTAALWLFNDGQGTTTFADASSNDNDLFGHNGAIVIGGDTPGTFEIVSVELTPEGKGVIQWNSEDSQFYTIQYSTNLLNGFSDLKNNLPGNPPLNVYTDNVEEVQQKFWRIIKEP